jgi:hypothetical protein
VEDLLIDAGQTRLEQQMGVGADDTGRHDLEAMRPSLEDTVAGIDESRIDAEDAPGPSRGRGNSSKLLRPPTWPR